METDRTAVTEAAPPTIQGDGAAPRPGPRRLNRDSVRVTERPTLADASEGNGCGSGSTCWRRLVRWQRAGVWRRLHAVLLAELRQRGRLNLARAIADSSSIRALRGGKKLDRTLPIAARRGNITFSLTRKGFRLQRG